MESGKFNLQLIEADVISLIRRIEATFQSLAHDKQIQLELETAPNHLHAAFDADILEKTLVNLIANSLKHTQTSGKITLSVWEESGREQEDRIYFRVADTGVGISEDHLPHIFDRFYQAQTDDYTTQQSGTGIGLALVKELIELHGGEISVESVLHQGTTFTFWIPRKKDAYQADEFTETKNKKSKSEDTQSEPPLAVPIHTEPPAISEDLSPASVLIVEDNPDVRAYLHTCLAGSYQILEAMDGEQGIEMAVKEIPDLVITDVMMPQ